MRRHAVAAGLWLSGASGIALFGYVTTAAKGGYPLWPYAVFGSLFWVGLLPFVTAQRWRRSITTDLDEPSAGSGTPTPAYTARWRHTANGSEAGPVMSITNVSMPSTTAQPDQGSYLRFGVCIACEPIAADASSSEIGSALLQFLAGGPVTQLVREVCGDRPASWTRLAGNGNLLFEAVLGESISDEPVASALFLPPALGMVPYGRADGTACLWLQLKPCEQAADLPGWHDRLMAAAACPGAFRLFLEEDLGRTSYGSPPARWAVLLHASRSMDELVDVHGLNTLPGAYRSTQFLSYAIADAGGGTGSAVATDLLRQLCDHTLHLTDFEPVLAKIADTETPRDPAG